MSSIPFKYIKPQALLRISALPEKNRISSSLSEGPITYSKPLEEFLLEISEFCIEGVLLLAS